VPQVPWSELGGDQAETLISNLLYSEHPKTATRVRPSRGDYGIDVVVPNASAPDKIDVYQIKKFFETLTANQRGQVEKSFRRFLLGFVRGGWPIADWYLLMPVDPTSEKDSDWFVKMPNAVIADMFEDAKLALTEAEKEQITAWRTTPGRIIEWEGRNACDTSQRSTNTWSTISSTAAASASGTRSQNLARSSAAICPSPPRRRAVPWHC
jgi:hypothetical protein